MPGATNQRNRGQCGAKHRAAGAGAAFVAWDRFYGLYPTFKSLSRRTNRSVERLMHEDGSTKMTMPAVVLTAEHGSPSRNAHVRHCDPTRCMVEVDLCGICGSDLHSRPAAAGVPRRLHPWTRIYWPHCRGWSRRRRLERRSTRGGQPQRKRLRGLRVLQVRSTQLLPSSNTRDGAGSASRRRTRAADGRISLPSAGHPA